MMQEHGFAHENVVIRRIRCSDVDALERFYADLSADSRALRFLGATPPLGHARNEAFCSADHEHREGFVAIARGPDGTERLVGHLCAEPDDVGSAEIAIAVADDYQGHGVGRRLVLAAVAWGRRIGLRRFDASAFATNARIIGLLRGLGLPFRIESRDGATCDMSIDLAAA